MLTRPAASLLILCLAAAAAVGATPASARCEFEGVKFACPVGFNVAPREAGERFAFFQRKKDRLGVFVAVAGESEDMRAFVGELLAGVMRKLLPGEQKEFKWALAAVPGKVSKFEVGGGAARAYNGNVLAVTKFRHVKFGGKSFIVGYVSELTRGREAAGSFENASDAEHMAGCSAVAELVFSVTGEVLEEPPCQLEFEVTAPTKH